jgi:hypothetical protein
MKFKSLKAAFTRSKRNIVRSDRLFCAQTDLHRAQTDYFPLRAIIARSEQLLRAQTVFHALRAINLRSDRFQRDVT